MDNRDWQVGHYREMADDSYFNRLAGKRRFQTLDEWEEYQQELFNDMTECERCQKNINDYSDCENAECEFFKCEYGRSCVYCGLSDNCYLYKKAHKAEGE